VVDDDSSVRETICEILKESGYECLMAPDGETALLHYSEGKDPFHLVILDWSMPGLDGADTYRRLREFDPKLKAILMSGYQRSEEIENMVAEGIKSYVSKPFQIGDLLSAVRSALED